MGRPAASGSSRGRRGSPRSRGQARCAGADRGQQGAPRKVCRDEQGLRGQGLRPQGHHQGPLQLWWLSREGLAGGVAQEVHRKRPLLPMRSPPRHPARAIHRVHGQGGGRGARCDGGPPPREHAHERPLLLPHHAFPHLPPGPGSPSPAGARRRRGPGHQVPSGARGLRSPEGARRGGPHHRRGRGARAAAGADHNDALGDAAGAVDGGRGEHRWPAADAAEKLPRGANGPGRLHLKGEKTQNPSEIAILTTLACGAAGRYDPSHDVAAGADSGAVDPAPARAHPGAVREAHPRPGRHRGPAAADVDGDGEGVRNPRGGEDHDALRALGLEG
mmetsp:Transcript_22571/g.70045  ORF Transcript_22571/g.70045 Transcript_22571/m.70045 type:complete len:332 (-) Transcript_22571:207-1202(-)